MASAWKYGVILGCFGALCVGLRPSAQPAGATGAQPALAPHEAAVAMVNGQAITAQQLLEHVRGEILAREAEIYEVKRRGVQALIDAALLTQAAQARGLREAELVAQEVEAKVGEVTATEVEEWYMANRPRLRRSLEKMRGEIVAALRQQKLQATRQAYVARLRAHAQIAVHLQPPIVAVSAEGAPRKGAPEAPITIVEFADFQCPYCQQVLPVLAAVLEQYPGQVSLAFRDFPLPGHPAAAKAAEAAHCAGEQGQFWAYHDLLFAQQGPFATADFLAHADTLGLERTAFQACLESGKHRATVAQHRAAGEQAGVTGTPTFFINGRLLTGAQPLEAFRALIDDALAQQAPQAHARTARTPATGGTPAE
jgi:protein-disulfide isomerase